jgi:hypothetical protein
MRVALDLSVRHESRVAAAARIEGGTQELFETAVNNRNVILADH